MPGTLYVVGTPIGNLEDISLRALRVLREADLVLAEDTRHTRGLFSRYSIHTRLVSYHEHNERQMAEQAVRWLEDGLNLALVSDAGLPAISDPGAVLIGAAAKQGLAIQIVPGPTAFALALIGSGLPSERFTFWGFLPRRQKERSEILIEALSRLETAVFYEAPTRIGRTLGELAALAPERPAAVARELTKIHEEIRRGSLSELADHFGGRETKGEICLLVAGRSPQEDALTAEGTPPATPEELVARLQAEGFGYKEAMREAGRRLGLSRRQIYQRLIEREK